MLLWMMTLRIKLAWYVVYRMTKKKVTREHPSLGINDVRSIRGHSYSVLRRSVNKIPTFSGVYIWRYWPDIPSLESEGLIDFLSKLQKNFPQQLEELKNSRVDVTIKRTPFGTGEDGRFLGISNEKKINNILGLLNEDSNKRQAFAHTLEVLISSFPPIYIGKADNLRSRLSDHFEGKSDVLPRIQSAEIPVNDIYISFIKDELTVEDKEITTSLEEILQRLTNPAYTKRYG